jgi:hypothetical protein
VVYASGSTSLVASNATVTFPATGCVVVDAHRKINCTTTEGAGFSIVWLLTIGNQTSQSPVTNYRAPTLDAVRVSMVLANGSLVSAGDPMGSLGSLATEGGEVVLVNGTNLGPAVNRTLVNSVSFGSGSVTYNLVNCSFVVAHTQLQCVTPPGVGAGYRAQVTVMYQSSSQSADVLSYKAPVISGVFPSVVPTSGATVTLNGSSFGAAPDQISLTVNGVSTPVSLSVAHKSLQVRVDEVPGAASLSVLVTVAGQVSNTVTVAFAAPTVDAVTEYNTSALAPAVQATDSCYAVITDINRDAIFQLQGSNLGSRPGSLVVTLTNGTVSGTGSWYAISC